MKKNWRGFREGWAGQSQQQQRKQNKKTKNTPHPNQKPNSCMLHSFLKMPPNSYWLPGNSKVHKHNSILLVTCSSLLHLEWHVKNMLGQKEKHYYYYSTCTSTHRKHRLLQSTQTKHRHKTQNLLSACSKVWQSPYTVLNEQSILCCGRATPASLKTVSWVIPVSFHRIMNSTL